MDKPDSTDNSQDAKVSSKQQKILTPPFRGVPTSSHGAKLPANMTPDDKTKLLSRFAEYRQAKKEKMEKAKEKTKIPFIKPQPVKPKVPAETRTSDEPKLLASGQKPHSKENVFERLFNNPTRVSILKKVESKPEPTKVVKSATKVQRRPSNPTTKKPANVVNTAPAKLSEPDKNDNEDFIHKKSVALTSPMDFSKPIEPEIKLKEEEVHLVKLPVTESFSKEEENHMRQENILLYSEACAEPDIPLPEAVNMHENLPSYEIQETDQIQETTETPEIQEVYEVREIEEVYEIQESHEVPLVDLTKVPEILEIQEIDLTKTPVSNSLLCKVPETIGSDVEIETDSNDLTFLKKSIEESCEPEKAVTTVNIDNRMDMSEPEKSPKRVLPEIIITRASNPVIELMKLGSGKTAESTQTEPASEEPEEMKPLVKKVKDAKKSRSILPLKFQGKKKEKEADLSGTSEPEIPNIKNSEPEKPNLETFESLIAMPKSSVPEIVTLETSEPEKPISKTSESEIPKPNSSESEIVKSKTSELKKLKSKISESIIPKLKNSESKIPKNKSSEQEKVKSKTSESVIPQPKSSDAEKSKSKTSVRRSISTIYRNKSGDVKSAIHRTASQDSMNFQVEPIKELSFISEEETENMKIRRRSRSFSKKKRNEESVSDEIEESNVLSKQEIKEKIRRSKSVSFLTPKKGTPKKEIPTPLHLMDNLETWLKKRGQSINNYRHLKCFGIQAQAIPNLQTPARALADSLDTSHYATAPNTPIDESDKENMTPPVPIQFTIPRIDLEEVEGWLADLLKLIKELKYPYSRCEEWLSAIRKKCSSCTQLPIYWECLAAIEESRGDMESAIEYYQRAIIKGGEVDAVGDSLADLFDKLVLDKEKRTASKPDKAVDPKNVFKSTIIKFALQQKAVKDLGPEIGDKAKQQLYIATPVRRSTRIQTPHKPNIVNSLRSLDEDVQSNVTFQPNKFLLSRE